MPRVILLIPVVLGLCLPAQTRADERGDDSIAALLNGQEEWRWVSLGAASGLPPGRVGTIQSDGGGTIWVGTDRGLAWFDGYQFLPPDTGGEPWTAADIRKIIRRENGDIAVLAGDTVWTGRSGRLRPVAGQYQVSQIAPAGADGLYILTAKGGYVERNGQVTPVTQPSGFARVFPGSAGNPWLLVSGKGLFHWKANGWQERAAMTAIEVVDAFSDDGKSTVVSIRSPEVNAGLWEIPAGLGPRRLEKDMARIATLLPNGEGIATFDSGDVRVRRRGRWASLDNNFSGAILRRATSVYIHENGEIWAGTNGSINMFRTRISRMRHKSFEPGDGRNNVHEILRRRNGELWMATSNGLVVQNPDGKWSSIAKVGKTRLGVVTGLNEDSDGTIWISSGSAFGGAFRFSDGKWRPVGKDEGLTDWPVHRIRRDRSGHLWFLTSYAAGQNRPRETGAFRLEERKFHFWGAGSGMPVSAVTSFDEAPDGAYWFGTSSGLFRYANGKWEHFAEKSGITFTRVYDVAVAPDGAVWFCHQRGLQGVGRLMRRSDGSAETRYFTEVDGVPSREVWAVYAEPDGRIWASTANGVGVYHGGPWVAAGLGYGIDGIKTWPLLLESEDLWFGTLGQGLFRVSREERAEAHPLLFFQPPVRTDELWHIGWRALAQGASLRPSDILTRHRVDGGEWEPWSATREYSIPASKPGQHRIEVQTVGALGDVESAPSSLTVDIPYPFYLKPEFIGILAILFACAGGIAIFNLRSRLRYTRELEIAKQKAEDSGKARSAFLAVISHEIRTPMNGVLGMTTLMLDTPLDQRQRDYMGTIRNSAEGLLSVINDVLDFSKIESGTFQITPAPFDLEEVCEQVVTLLGARAEEKGLVLAVDYPCAIPSQMVGDAGRVRQILLNLAGNAIKFTDRGFVRIGVDGETGPGAICRLRIQVEDTGIGIASEKIPLLFQEFSQVDSSAARRHGGTGLGLAISRKLAEHMGGSISVESAPGRGSKFCCELPFPLHGDAGRPPRPPIHGRCLILHPDPFIGKTLATYCRDLGLKAESFTGIDSLPGEPFHFVLTSEHWRHEITSRYAAEGASILPIEAQPSASAVPLIPLSRGRLRMAFEAGDRSAIVTEAALGPASGLQESRILVVEDNQTNQRVIRLLLERFGCTVFVAGNGEQAVELCETRMFDLVFMDVQMPVMDGLQATRRLRALHNPNSRVPILALTANALEEDRQRCLDAGMSGYLSKPIVRGELLLALRQYLPVHPPAPVSNP